MSGTDEISAIAGGSLARLVCERNVPVDQWPIVRTRAKLSDAEVQILSSDIDMISFNRRRWWIWPWGGLRRGSSDDPGALAPIRSIVIDYLDGKIGPVPCEKRFSELGLTLSTDVVEIAQKRDLTESWGGTDDPGCEEAAP
jgi:hypothetical protein